MLDGSNFVKLSRLKNIKHVLLNYKIALSVLDRVIKDLEHNNLFNEYSEVFKQEKENIIERFHVKPKNYSHYIWVPHRPVIREGPLVTTKVPSETVKCSLLINYVFIYLQALKQRFPITASSPQYIIIASFSLKIY